MPNQITATGLQTQTQAELIAFFTAAFQEIYGPDINLDSDSPDGQLMMIFIQSVLDELDLITQVYNSMDPDLAIGVSLDERCAINGIQRQAGTFTITPVTITTDRAINLAGLDGDLNNPNGTGYTVADNAGNKWILVSTQTIGTAGIYEFSFRAQNPGAVLTTPNTIQVPVTVVIGVTSINNPTTYLTLGFNEESDAALKIRRQKSVALSSQGFLQGLLAALANVSGVTAAFVYENVTGSTDGDGIPSHSIWVIVQGGSAADIANAIYLKRNAGCGMFGAQTFDVTQVDGSLFTIKWDYVTAEDLFIKFNATSMNGVDSINTTRIKDQLVLLLTPGVHERVNVNELGTLVQEIDPNCLITSAGFSLTLMGSYTNTLTPSAKDKQFSVSAANISITVV